MKRIKILLFASFLLMQSSLCFGDFEWLFTTSQDLSPEGEAVGLPDAAIDGNGNVIVVWVNNTASRMQSRRYYVRGGKWQDR